MSDTEQTVHVDPREATDLAVHVTACEHRYRALDNRTQKTNHKLDRVDKKVSGLKWWIIGAMLVFFAADKGTTAGAFVKQVIAGVAP